MTFFNVLKTVNCRANFLKLDVVDRPGPLAQLAERGADNAKVLSSSLTWTMTGRKSILL